jgi:hypothetical protein
MSTASLQVPSPSPIPETKAALHEYGVHTNSRGAERLTANLSDPGQFNSNCWIWPYLPPNAIRGDHTF